MHSEWVLGSADDRNWDLIVSYYETELAPPEPAAMLWSHQPGGNKYPALYSLITEHLDLILSYEYIFVPDDDLVFEAGSINMLFQHLAKNDVDLGQPSLDPRSFSSRAVTVYNPLCSIRFTNWIEGMAPCFKASILLDCLWTFPLSRTGWGLDNAWSHIIDSRGGNIAIVDAVQMFHPRPFGGPNHRSTALCGRTPYDDLREVHATLGIQEPRVILRKAIDRDGRRISDHELYRSPNFLVPPF
jgi:hypothetical protein